MINDKTEKQNVENRRLYLSIDHLDKGTYALEILDKNKVVKTVNIIKK